MGAYCTYVLWVHAYILWVTVTHNIYVLHPQYIARTYMLWVYIVGDSSFTDVVSPPMIKRKRKLNASIVEVEEEERDAEEKGD